MAAIRSDEDADDLLGEIVDRYGEPPRGVLNLVDIALLRAKAKECAVTDIRQKAGEIWFTLASLNIDAVGRICSDADYQKRVQFVASAKVPTLRLKLAPKVDTLKQTKVFVEKYRTLCTGSANA
jgi:transcription-repair coupling factor (superfamily II helicase)